MELTHLIYDESGQGLMEYSLILSLVAIAAISAVLLFGDSVYDIYEEIRKYVLDAL